MINITINHAAWHLPALSILIFSQKCRCANEECCGIKSQTFLPLTPAGLEAKQSQQKLF